MAKTSPSTPTSTSLLEAILLPPSGKTAPLAQIVLLHGWGANSQDLVGLTPAIDLPNYLFCCPNAPFPHPQVPGGRMWYDLESEDREGLDQSRKLLLDWLQELGSITSIGLDRTILAGFSQGGAMTLDVGLKLPVAGLVVFSGYLHPDLQVQSQHLPPILVMHGRFDYVVPLQAAHQTRTFLEQHEANLTYREFDMGHDIPPVAIAQMREFVQTLFVDA